MSNQSKQLILFLIVTIVVIGTLVFVNSTNEKQKTELFQLRKNIKSYDLLPSNSEIEKKIEHLNKEKILFEPYLFDIEKPLLFIEKIEETAKSHNVTVSVENPETVRFDEKSSNGQISLDVVSTGNLEDLRDFLEEIENFQREVKTNSVRLSKIETEEGSTWRIMFSIIGKAK